MRQTTTIAETPPLASSPDVLTEVCRTGARQMLAQAIEAEVAAYLDSRSALRDEAGRCQVVRNGRLPRRTILTGVGAVEVQQPRVRDRRPAAEREKFSSAIPPPYLGSISKASSCRAPWRPYGLDAAGFPQERSRDSQIVLPARRLFVSSSASRVVKSNGRTSSGRGGSLPRVRQGKLQ
jgi:putative transposase